jgi:hypothetical protein
MNIFPAAEGGSDVSVRAEVTPAPIAGLTSSHRGVKPATPSGHLSEVPIQTSASRAFVRLARSERRWARISPNADRDRPELSATNPSYHESHVSVSVNAKGWRSAPYSNPAICGIEQTPRSEAIRTATARTGRSYSVGVNITGARPTWPISPIIRIIWWGTQRSIGGAPSSTLIVNLAKKWWSKSIRAHARMSRVSLGVLPDGVFFTNARNSLASCGDRSGRRRTK